MNYQPMHIRYTSKWLGVKRMMQHKYHNAELEREWWTRVTFEHKIMCMHNNITNKGEEEDKFQITELIVRVVESQMCIV